MLAQLTVQTRAPGMDKPCHLQATAVLTAEKAAELVAAAVQKVPA